MENNFKFLKSFLYPLGFLVLSAGIVWAGSTTLTTYYPAPTGNYNQVIANNIGIGTTKPAQSLDVESGNIGIGTTYGYYLQASTPVPIAWGQTGLYNYYFGGAGNNTGTGSYNTAVGYGALANVTTGYGITGIGYGVKSSAATDNTEIIIGYNITGKGSNTATAPVAWGVPSDRRLKTDIKDSDLGLDFVEKLHPVSFRMKGSSNQHVNYGFIAQEVEQALAGRDANMVGPTGDKMKTYTLIYTDLIAPVVKAIQELAAKFNALEAENKALEARIEKLEKIK